MVSKMIRTYLQGGLGNQCFIYDAMRALLLRMPLFSCLLKLNYPQLEVAKFDDSRFW